MRCSCGSKSGFYWTGKERNEVRCDKCGKVGSMEEFGCVVHCNDKASAVEPTLTRIEQGLGGVDEAASLREQLATLQQRVDWERECNRQAGEEIAEARYWARRLYWDTAVDTQFNVPEWVTWVDGSSS